jgi:hypothetical protein
LKKRIIFLNGRSKKKEIHTYIQKYLYTYTHIPISLFSGAQGCGGDGWGFG